MKQLQVPRGTQDTYGIEARKWQIIEEKIREITKLYNVSEMRTPIFEHTEVFNRENDSSDMVNKEMYTFEDHGGRSLTLKPEGTAGLIRAYVSNKLFAQPEPVHKYYYITPVFRYERPQKGRLRIHHQFGVEFLGQSSPVVDVEVIALGLHFLKMFDISDVTVYINTLGDDESRENYRAALKEHFKPHLEGLCGDCKRRYEQNPLRILDCKVDHQHPAMKTAPKMSDYLNEESKAYFEKVKELLDNLGINYVVDEKLVRGLDYYSHTVFEVKPNQLDSAQNTLLAGGHYDHLVEQLGGPAVSSVGFGMGLERFLLTLENEEIDILEEEPIDIYGLALGEKASEALSKIIYSLRQQGFSAEMDLGQRGLKAQFKSADRTKAKVLLILGEEELNNQEINIKNTMTQEQKTVKLEDLDETLVFELMGINLSEVLEDE